MAHAELYESAQAGERQTVAATGGAALETVLPYGDLDEIMNTGLVLEHIDIALDHLGALMES